MGVGGVVMYVESGEVDGICVSHHTHTRTHCTLSTHTVTVTRGCPAPDTPPPVFEIVPLLMGRRGFCLGGTCRDGVECMMVCAVCVAMMVCALHVMMYAQPSNLPQPISCITPLHATHHPPTHILACQHIICLFYFISGGFLGHTQHDIIINTGFVAVELFLVPLLT